MDTTLGENSPVKENNNNKKKVDYDKPSFNIRNVSS